MTQIAKAGEADSWLLQAQTALKPGENGLSPKRQCDPCDNGEAAVARLARKVLRTLTLQVPVPQTDTGMRGE